MAHTTSAWPALRFRDQLMTTRSTCSVAASAATSSRDDADAQLDAARRRAEARHELVAPHRQVADRSVEHARHRGLGEHVEHEDLDLRREQVVEGVDDRS